MALFKIQRAWCEHHTGQTGRPRVSACTRGISVSRFDWRVSSAVLERCSNLMKRLSPCPDLSDIIFSRSGGSVERGLDCYARRFVWSERVFGCNLQPFASGFVVINPPSSDDDNDLNSQLLTIKTIRAPSQMAS